MIKELKYYEDEIYMQELDFRREVDDLEQYIEDIFLLDYKYIKYEHLEIKNHYSDIFVNDIQWSRLALYIRDVKLNEFLRSSRVFKFLIGRYGLEPFNMFNIWKTESYIEIQDNYLSSSINSRLTKLAKIIEDDVELLLEDLKKTLTSEINKYNNSEYYQGSESDYKEFLTNQV